MRVGGEDGTYGDGQGSHEAASADEDSEDGDELHLGRSDGCLMGRRGKASLM